MGLFKCKPVSIVCELCGEESVLPAKAVEYYRPLIKKGESIICGDCTMKVWKAIESVKKLDGNRDLATKRLDELTEMRTVETAQRLLSEIDEERMALTRQISVEIR